MYTTCDHFSPIKIKEISVSQQKFTLSVSRINMTFLHLEHDFNYKQEWWFVIISNNIINSEVIEHKGWGVLCRSVQIHTYFSTF